MQKGKWVLTLIKSMWNREISVVGGVTWALGRFGLKSHTISLYNITFNKIDSTFWGIITDVFLNQVYTPPGFEIIPNDIVIDIGAHKGAFTAFSSTKGAGKIIAYEPNPDNFASLKMLISKNGINNVAAYQKGVGAKTGKTKLFLSATSSRHSIVLQPEELNENNSIKKSIIVDIVSLDDCLKDFEIINFLKMDCEDAEREILLNTNNNTISKIQKISIEIHKPANSNEITQLINHLKNTYSHITIDQPKNSIYGYIYARK